MTCNLTLSSSDYYQFKQATINSMMVEYFVDDILVIDRVGLVIENSVAIKSHLNLTIFYSHNKVNKVIVNS
jgi:hypothetical protein